MVLHSEVEAEQSHQGQGERAKRPGRHDSPVTWETRRGRRVTVLAGEISANSDGINPPPFSVRVSPVSSRPY